MRLTGGFSSLFLPKQKSLIRSLDARVKMFWFVSIIILSLNIQDMACLSLLFLSTIVYSLLARAIRTHLLVARRMLFFAGVSLLLMLIVIRDTEYLMGTVIQIVSKLFIMTSTGILFASTTSPHDLVLALDRLRVPQMLTFPLTVAMRFVPTLLREVREIVDSLRLRGMETGFRTFLRHPGLAYRGIFIPLTIRSIAVSDELAAAAETRGFGSPARRTSLREERIRGADYVFLLIVAFFSVALTLSDYMVWFK